jgi:hypothetical protein
MNQKANSIDLDQMAQMLHKNKNSFSIQRNKVKTKDNVFQFC